MHATRAGCVMGPQVYGRFLADDPFFGHARLGMTRSETECCPAREDTLDPASATLSADPPYTGCRPVSPACCLNLHLPASPLQNT